jgi:hypothetical protein
MDRARVWLAVSPIILAGVLTGHALAYRLTGTPTDAVHGYLDHAPQVVLILALVAPLLARRARWGAFALWPFPSAGVATFVIQEHVERVVHSGQVPWLLASPAFLVGVLLQVPVAVVVWALARRLLAVLVEALPARRRLLPRLVLDVVLPAPFDVRAVAAAPLPGRGPPFLRTP